MGGKEAGSGRKAAGREPGDLALGYVSGSTVSAAWVRCLTAAIIDGRFGQNIISVTCGPMLSRGRNLVAEVFLRTQAQRLVFVDTDIVFHPHDLDALLASKADVAYGVYLSEDSRLVLEGLGFVAIKRRVLEEIPRPFDYHPLNGVLMGEDKSFFHACKLEGFSVEQTDVVVGHEKPQVIRP